MIAVTTAFVYVGADGKHNLDIAIDLSVWGWKASTAETPQNQGVLQSLKEGDRLILGHLGLGRISLEEAQTRTVSELVVTRLTSSPYQDTSTVWPDDDYPYRVRLDILEIRENVTKDDIGAESIEALRQSASTQGSPRLPGGQGSELEAFLEQEIEKYKQELPDPEDPADSTNLELPPVLDLPAYVLARAEQKKLRKAKLKGRTQVHCDLCHLLLPARLVHTAHVKKRSKSSYQERCDPANLMLACVLGCDSLFEHGYVYVAADGSIHPSVHAKTASGLGAAVERVGRTCSAHTDASAGYFEWHRHNIASMNES
ncbi:hypothetical protein [Nocardiopsis sp. B62]|uniref:hypothetical protein n=1 Tax=Nocardiopsis sp. B62 TaxID=2824874 RepID=UPI0027DD44DB|nr:hypothetical protein [Nocardiopsis sp. B62]